jgi:hypothetical protein
MTEAERIIDVLQREYRAASSNAGMNIDVLEPACPWLSSHEQQKVQQGRAEACKDVLELLGYTVE